MRSCEGTSALRPSQLAAASRSIGDPPKPLPAPKKLNGAPHLAGDALKSWHLEPRNPDWAGGLRESWTPGEASARTRLKQFLRSIAGYAGDRDRPDREGTSRLSPHLRFGEISPRQIWHVMPLNEINNAFELMKRGESIRGVVTF